MRGREVVLVSSLSLMMMMMIVAHGQDVGPSNVDISIFDVAGDPTAENDGKFGGCYFVI